MDAPISSCGLFAVNLVVERFQESAKQAAAFHTLLPRWHQIFDSMEANAKYFSLGPADHRMGLSNIVWVLPTQVYWVLPTVVGPEQVLVMEQEVNIEVLDICTSLQQGHQVLQLFFLRSKNGWGAASHFGSKSSERVSHTTKIQNVNFEKNHFTDQIRGLVCHERSQGRILPCTVFILP